MKKILIIDDFEPFRTMTRRVVERLGYTARACADGRDGLDAFDQERPDIVITDLNMPNVDGMGVLCAIKQKSPETEVVVLTGFATEAVERELLRQGAFACLKKPLTLDQIVRVISRIREKRQTTQDGVRPVALLRMDSEEPRAFVERVLRAEGCELRVPATREEWRRAVETGDMDLLVWEVHPGDAPTLQRVMSMRSARAGFEVLLILTEYGAAESAAREVLTAGDVECVGEPLDEAALAGAVERSLKRLLQRRSEVHKRERGAAVGAVSLSVTAGGGLVVDLRANGGSLEALAVVAERFPWPWLVINGAWETVYVSPLVAGWFPSTPAKLDRALWDGLTRQGLTLPALEDLYSLLARCSWNESVMSLESLAGVGVLPLKIMPSTPLTEGLIAVLLPTPVRPTGGRALLPGPSTGGFSSNGEGR